MNKLNDSKVFVFMTVYTFIIVTYLIALKMQMRPPVFQVSYLNATAITGLYIFGGRFFKNEPLLLFSSIPGRNRDPDEPVVIENTWVCTCNKINGHQTMRQIRDVDVSDLLGRDQISFDNMGITEYLEGKTILVTGGGGSIGSELCRQIIKFNPALLLILDCYENNAYDIYNELHFYNSDLPVKVIIASVTDRSRMEEVFIQYRPAVVFHAAAHKHVPLMEANPTEAIKNNVFGTLITAECANMVSCRKFVMISTDKAVNPTNIMGASKRICEMIIQMMNACSYTEFVAVRFGNVLGSNGSVIPLFKKQIAKGGPVTVTDERITRYFMTIQEAVQLVLQAGAFAEGGEIFVLDMGRPIKIYDLACDLIRLTGFEVHQEIQIKIIGLRPGEKLYEELLMAEEGLLETRHKKIYIGKPMFINVDKYKRCLAELKDTIDSRNRQDLYRLIQELVPTYRRSEEGEEILGFKELQV